MIWLLMFPLRAVQRLIFLGLARLLPPLNFQDLTQTKFSALISQGNEIFAPLREAHVTFMTEAVFKRFPSKSLSLTQCLVTNYFFSVIFMQSLDKYASTSSRNTFYRSDIKGKKPDWMDSVGKGYHQSEIE